jgi:hypothetical protein
MKEVALSKDILSLTRNESKVDDTFRERTANVKAINKTVV